jgi:hypothetical protein
METLYTTGLEIHFAGIVVLFAVVLFNVVMLALSHQVIRYAKRMRIVMPISASLITISIFTGSVMMAAKHLHFSFANVAMILVSILFIILEIKRYTLLKYKTDIRDDNALTEYKQKAFPILGVEVSLLVLMSIWMLG